MLNDSGPSLSNAGQSEVCKPNYEKIIGEAKESLGKVAALKDALFGYIGNPMRVKGPLAEMSGELIVEERSTQSKIERLISEQERAQPYNQPDGSNAAFHC